MDKAKAALNKFTSGDGKHTTTVDETVNKAATEEHIRPHRHEEFMPALDKEVHQDHHHTVVQPVQDHETLPDKHTFNAVPTTHKTIDHRDEQRTRDKLNTEAARFENTSTQHEATHSTSTAAMLGSEHIHHHVHEHVQPVIQKEVDAPEYVHTAVPVHETHHLDAQHHGTSVLPPIGINEFDGKREILGGQPERRVNEFEGCPRPYQKGLQTERTKADEHMHSSQKDTMQASQRF